MKFLALILSVYIFTLNIVPCEDGGVPDSEVKTEISQHSSNDNHQHQGGDLCSPFCQCHCCHIHATDFVIVDYTVVTIVSTEVFFHFNGIEKDFNTSILQPPQV